MTEQQKQLPEGWMLKDLVDCAEILDAKRIPLNNKERQARIDGKSPSELYPYLGATGQVGLIDNYLFDGEYLLIGEDGAPFFDKSRNVAFLWKGKFWVNNHAHILNAKSEITSNRYLFYYLNSFNYRGYVGGTTRLKLNQSSLKKIPVSLAPPKQQKQIVAKIEELFSHIDAGVESLKIAKEKLKQYRQSVLKAAVTGELTKDWREANKDKIEPADQLLQRIIIERRQRWEQQQLDQFQAKGKLPKNDKWKEKYKEPDYNGEVFFDDIPSGWSSAKIDTLAFDVRYGSSSKTNDDSSGVPVIRMGNIIDGKLDFSNLKYLPVDHQEFPELLLSDRDLLFNRTNSAELVGKTAIFFDKGRPVSLASYVIRVRLLSGVESQFVANFINSTIGRAWIKSCVSQNVGQANVNGTKLKALVVPLPPLKEQKEIVRIVDEKLTAADRLMEEIDTKLTQAQQQKQTILASAFKGEII